MALRREDVSRIVTHASVMRLVPFPARRASRDPRASQDDYAEELELWLFQNFPD
jgi:hypothetical protein